MTGAKGVWRWSFSGLALVVGVATVACVEVSGSGTWGHVEHEEKQFLVTGTPDIDVSTFDGSVDLRAWDRADVLVRVEKRAISRRAAEDILVTTGQEGNRITVHVKPRRWGGFLEWGDSGSAKVIVSVPRRANVVATTGDGSIVVAGVAGTISLQSGDGSISGNEVSGTLKVRTGDGSIRLAAVEGQLEAGTGDGSIAVDGKLTSLRLRTGDGRVRVEAAPGSATEGEWDITTGDGSIELALPDGFGGELDAHTGDGRIRLDQVSISNVSGALKDGTIRGRLGAGGRTVRVRSGDGSITFERF